METRLLKKQMTAAYQYSYVRLVLNYYTLFETVGEEPVIPEQIIAYCRQLNGQLKEHFSGKMWKRNCLNFVRISLMKWRF
ncbi:hypothetical protein [Lacrimispora celerecrescens]|uniref:hypothetical protein n=1 Tax=Lacrimispora celerecrescens TaxID=29354 RepID=UPI000AD0F7D3|nr:hypothetical protein [Lacrimispora celerecrescens]